MDVAGEVLYLEGALHFELGKLQPSHYTPKCFVKHGLCICCLCILFYEGENIKTSFLAITGAEISFLV